MVKVTYFTAPSCAPCKMLRPKIEKLAEEMRFELEPINIDDPENASRVPANLMSVPTLLIEADDYEPVTLTGPMASFGRIRATIREMHG